MIRDPTPFDVVVMPNMYGDFISEVPRAGRKSESIQVPQAGADPHPSSRAALAVLAMLVGGLQFQAQSNVGDARPAPDPGVASQARRGSQVCLFFSCKGGVTGQLGHVMALLNRRMACHIQFCTLGESSYSLGVSVEGRCLL